MSNTDTPQPTDKCAKCERTYYDHLPFGSEPHFWCNDDLNNEDYFTPIVPSPDSVKDMGEVTKHTPGPWTVLGKASHGWNVGVPGMVIATVYSYDALSDTLPNAELIAAAPATAARLEEVLAENERLKEINQHLENAYRQSYQDHREALTKAASALKEMEVVIDTQHEAIVHFLGPQAPAEFSESKTKLHYVINEIESALRGATEQQPKP